MPKNPPKGPISVADFNAQLAADPEYQAKRRAFVAKQKALDEFLARAEAPVVDALQRAGFSVSSVWDLVNTAERYTAALPILLDHLQRDYPDRVREGIARAMAVPESKFAWQTLLNLFRHSLEAKPNGVKWAIGLALAAAADDEVMPDVIALFRDRRHGENRLAFTKALKRSRLANARAALEQGREDPQLVKEISRELDSPRRRAKGRAS
jgi:hypothetical protein